VDVRRGETYLTFGREVLNLRRINIGDRIWKTSDPELDKRVRQSYEQENAFQRPVDFEIHGSVGEPLVAILRDRTGHVVQVDSTMVCQEAHSKPIDRDKLRDQFGRLGGTPFELGTLTNHTTGKIMVPVSELNRMRREGVEKLEGVRSEPKRWQMAEQTVAPPAPNSGGAGLKSGILGDCQLVVLVRSLEQLTVAIESGVSTIYCEFEDPRRYGEAVVQVRSAAHRPQIFVAPPRITKMGENWILEQVLKSDSDGYLVRNYDHLKFFQNRGAKLVGDFSLNVANPLTAKFFKTQYPIDRLTASYDLNIQQLTDLLHTTPPDWLEITLHQHMPMFHMEHCVFCAFLSEGTDFTNCGRPCDTHQVKLRDRAGTEHLLQADAGCRNTVFNGVAQTGAEEVQKLIDLGARHFRIEFVHETPQQVKQTIRRYQQLLAGDITGGDLWRSLKADNPVQNQLGVTRGTILEK
jgi:U32 family peptidase